MIAEWHKQAYLLLSYPTKQSDWACCYEEICASYDALIASVARYQKVKLIGHKRYEHPNVESIVHRIDDTWGRDYFPISVKIAQKIVQKNFVFNGWGYKFDASRDNAINEALFGLPKIDFVLEGGSLESNGEGIVLTTSECLLNPNRNPRYSKAQIEVLLHKELHIQKVLWLESGFLIGDDTDSHIDMIARFVARDTIVYLECEDEHDAHYEAFREVKKELQSFRDMDGNPFKLVALPFCETLEYEGERLPASYANFIIINGAVIVPTYNMPTDVQAIATLQGLFEDREIIGVDARVFVRQHGSLHCACMNIYEE